MLEPFITGIPAQNIYNFNETGFQIGQGKDQKVVTVRPNQAKRGNLTVEMGELVSAVECITADGFTLMPYFIFKGKEYMERWYNSDIPGQYHIAISPKGYSTDYISLDWIQHFNYHIKSRLLKKNEP